ncbi:MAG: Ribosomal large subunit pseudouridine synthase [Labilithrix sp.]|nr:Ribosomal large subunit pseudouridine synthase [Labilithrix sp.]
MRPGDGRTVGDIVQRAGDGVAAIAEGRVFVGKKRSTRADAPVQVGETVRIGAPRSAEPDRAPTAIDILFHEDGLVACVKPAGLPTVPDLAGAAHSLVALVAKAIGKKAEDLRVTSRLDRDVSGVVLFALDAPAEERLKAARAEGRYRRRYVALAAQNPQQPLADEGIWGAPIGRATDPRLRLARGPEAKDAMTRWRKIATAGPAIAMLAVDPVTGRTHQIRIHASDAGAPLVGDRDYGGPTRLVLPNGRILAPSRIALHAARVVVPGIRDLVEARAPIPAELEETWRAFGGSTDAWESAIMSEIPHAH